MDRLIYFTGANDNNNRINSPYRGNLEPNTQLFCRAQCYEFTEGRPPPKKKAKKKKNKQTNKQTKSK